MGGPLRVPGFEDIGFGEPAGANDAAMLRRNALFSGLGEEPLARVLPAFRMATLPREALLYVRGRIARRVFLIASGSVAIVQRTAHRPTTVALLGPAAFTGEHALLRPRGRHAFSAVCRAESRIGFVDGDVLLAALPGLPWVGLNVAWAMHRRVADAGLAIDALIAEP